eukprot:scaffold7548_cov126-Isochrysis_galbana.AAC.6
MLVLRGQHGTGQQNIGARNGVLDGLPAPERAVEEGHIGHLPRLLVAVPSHPLACSHTTLPREVRGRGFGCRDGRTTLMIAVHPVEDGAGGGVGIRIVDKGAVAAWRERRVPLPAALGSAARSALLSERTGSRGSSLPSR